MTAAPPTWGCRLEGLRLRRLGDDGRVSFELAREAPLDITAGGDELALLPVMGRSGAGKSTLMNVLSATTIPAPATARVTWRFPNGDTFDWRGDGSASAPLHRVRGQYFGYAFQQARLLPHLTAAENLVLGRVNLGEAPSRALERARALMLPTFGHSEQDVSRILSLYPAQMSGGERQRVALLMAVVRDPYVLFADEPTGSLDRDTRVEVMRLLRDWVAGRPRERMLIWVTHHDRDPTDTGTYRRLWVADGTFGFEETRDGEHWLPHERIAA